VFSGRQRSFFLCLIVLCCAGNLAAQEQAAQHQSSRPRTSIDLSCVLATTLQTKARLSLSAESPFFAGNSFLTRGNTVKATVGAELSPVSVNGTFDLVCTPVAFFQLIGGASAGSGWNLPVANGIAINERDGLHGNDLSGAPFLGMVWSAKAGSAVQFDLAAVLPGAWNHVVFRSAHELKYRALTSADAGDSWLYEGDFGENRNGWNYYGNCFIGYRMPIFLETVAFLVEADRYLYGAADGDLWGDGLFRWTFGPAVGFRFSEKTTMALIAQMRTMRNFTDGTEDYGFYQDRVLDSDDKLRVEFYRVAATVSVKLR